MNNLSLDLRNYGWAGQSSVSDSQFNTRNKLNQLLAEPWYIMRSNLNYFVNRAHAELENDEWIYRPEPAWGLYAGWQMQKKSERMIDASVNQMV